MDKVDLLIIGGGAAGMAAAYSAYESGVKKILIAERHGYLGGVLNQCLHDGFGLGYFGENLTGSQYAERYMDKLNCLDIDIRLNTTVLNIYPDKTALISSENGAEIIAFDRCILASGCRERTVNSLPVTGSRPSGVFTAGCAQKMVNISGLDVGDNIVILGTGDIGQIMARHFIQNGRNVIAMIEMNDRPGGLKRNRENCIEAYNIPVICNSTIDEIEGEGRISGVYVKHLDRGEREFIECDTLITALGLIPERELLAEISEGGRLPEWISTCGNCDYVHDIVDSVTVQAEKAGKEAANG